MMARVKRSSRFDGGAEMDEPPEASKRPDMLPWVLLTVLTFFCFSDPWLSIFNHRAPVFGVPLILYYLFAVWLLLIVLSARLKPPE